MKKLCIKCLEKKDIKEFNDSSNPVPSVIGTCKSCLKKYNAAYYKDHMEQIIENQKLRKDVYRKNRKRRES
jgi:hypothetical protein